MEGVTQEACSLAGHWGLGKLICFYDDNKISIDGSTDIAFTEDVSKRFEALNWQVRTAAAASLRCRTASAVCNHQSQCDSHVATQRQPRCTKL